VIADHFDLSVGDFVVQAAPAAVAATVVGWFAHRRTFAPRRVAGMVDEPVDRRALWGGDGQETKSPPAVIDHGTPTTRRAARK